jgi:putative acetyltransferase
MTVTLAVESPLQDEVRAMIAELNAYLLERTPAEYCYHMTAEDLAEPGTTVFVARDETGAAIGMGALKRHTETTGEVKRMFTRSGVRGHGVGRRLLDAIMDTARAEGLAELVLETGDRHEEAWRLYERGGFERCGPVLDYPDSPYSIFYKRAL